MSEIAIMDVDMPQTPVVLTLWVSVLWSQHVFSSRGISIVCSLSPQNQHKKDQKECQKASINAAGAQDMM